VELPSVSTNHSSQWSLNMIEVLDLVGDAIPHPLPAAWT
jgi:hypothetical protein